MAQTAAQRAEKLTVRYAEGLAEIDAGAGPGWAADLAAAVRAGERPSAFARRTERDRSSVYAALNDPHRDKARKRKGTFVCSDWPEIERLYHQGLTYREIGERIGDSLGGVGNKVARMREVGYDLPTRWRSRTVA